MSLERHEHAEALMAAADTASVQGRPDEARVLYVEAALAEAEAFTLIPLERPKTRGVVAVSSVALFRKAGDPIEASRRAHAFLAGGGLAEGAVEDLEDLLQDLRAEKIELESGRVLGSDWLEWRLTGNGIGSGTAPMPLVAQKIDQIQKLAVRTYEYLSGLPLRVQGPADESVREGMELVMSQPAAGSFKFSLRLSMPKDQLALFGQTAGLPMTQVSDTFFRVLESSLNEDAKDLANTIDSEDYRNAFLHLVRNLVPDGRQLGAIEVRHHGTDNPAVAVIRPTQRASLDRRIRASRSPRPKTNRERVRVDVLRGLQLNKGWIDLGAEGRERRCYVGEAIVLEDAVEGLVNRRVRVTGHMAKTRFIIEDIVEASADDADQ